MLFDLNGAVVDFISTADFGELAKHNTLPTLRYRYVGCQHELSRLELPHMEIVDILDL